MKSVMYFTGGAMAGVFSSGILAELEKQDAYSKIDSIYGGSGGAFNIAFFLSRQTSLGQSIYCEDLANNFICSWKVLTGAFQRFWDRYFFQLSKAHNPINIDFLMNIVEKQLDTEEIKKQDMSAFVKTFNLSTRRIEFLDLKQDTINLLKTAVNVIPYYFSKNEERIDGELVEPIGLELLLARHPDQQIVIVLNYSPKQGLKHDIKSSLEGIFASMMYRGKTMYKLFHKRSRKITRDVSKAIEIDRVLFIYPPENNPSTLDTIDPKKLRATYELGRKASNKILEFIS